MEPRLSRGPGSIAGGRWAGERLVRAEMRHVAAILGADHDHVRLIQEQLAGWPNARLPDAVGVLLGITRKDFLEQLMRGRLLVLTLRQSDWVMIAEPARLLVGAVEL